VPTYSYACTGCDNRFDVVQAFTDDALTTCEQCSGRLRKLFSSVGVVFKGSGFYRTDSRESGKSEKSSTNGSAKTSSSAGSDAPNSSTASSSSEKSTTSSDKSDSAKSKSVATAST
jgi:putative FmdB family regulatory protein